MMIKRAVLCCAVIGMALSADCIQADIVNYFDPISGLPGGQVNPSTLVPDILDDAGIGRDHYQSESVLEHYQINETYTDLTFTLYRDGGNFEFDFGFYKVNTITADPVSEKQAYATQALAPGNAVRVFDDRLHNQNDQVTITLADIGLTASDVIAFFIIPNNTLDAFQTSPGDFYAGSSDDMFRSPLFTCSDANPGQLDQMLSFGIDGDSSQTVFLFEDMTRTLLSPDPDGSDWDFDDVSFKVIPELTPIPESGTLILISAGCLACLFRRQKR